MSMIKMTSKRSKIGINKKLPKRKGASLISKRVDKLAKDGEISGQIAYYLHNGRWPR